MSVDINDLVNSNPLLFWPIVITFALIGFITILLKLYEMITKHRSLRKQYKLDIFDEYDRAINLKDIQLNDYERYNKQLLDQINELQRVSYENYRKDLSENEKEQSIEQYRDALLTLLWMYERERTNRIALTIALSTSKFSKETRKFLYENYSNLVNFSDSNDDIRSSIDFNSDDILEELKQTLHKYTYDLPIKEEGYIINSIFDEIVKIPIK